MSDITLNLPECIAALRRAVETGDDGSHFSLTEPVAAEITRTLSHPAFLAQPETDQFSFLEFVQYVYSLVSHVSALRQAEAIQVLFQAYLRRDGTPLRPLLKLYDLAYFLYWCAAVSVERQRGFDPGVVVPFSDFLRRRGLTMPAAVRPLRRGAPLRICYLGEFLSPGNGNALALVAEGALQSLAVTAAGRYELYLYAWKYHEEAFLQRFEKTGVTVRRFDLRDYSETELERLKDAFREDQIDVAWTDMNSAVPHVLFAGRVAPVQLYHQHGLPFWRVPEVDGVFLGWQLAPALLGFHPDQCRVLQAPFCGGALDRPVDAAVLQAEREALPRDKRLIGFYGRLVKVTPEYLEMVRQILERRPEVAVVLGGTGDAAFIKEFIKAQALQERLVVVDKFVDGQAWGHLLDIFLDTFPLTGGYSCREVMAKGKPLVHLLSPDMPNLNRERDPALQAKCVADYVELVCQLLSDPAAYRQAGERSLELFRAAAQSGARTFGEAFERNLLAILNYTAQRKMKTNDTTAVPLAGAVAPQGSQITSPYRGHPSSTGRQGLDGVLDRINARLHGCQMKTGAPAGKPSPPGTQTHLAPQPLNAGAPGPKTNGHETATASRAELVATSTRRASRSEPPPNGRFRTEMKKDDERRATFQGRGFTLKVEPNKTYPHADVSVVRDATGERLDVFLPYSHLALGKMITGYDFKTVLEIGSREGAAARAFEFCDKEVFTVEVDPAYQCRYTGDFLDVKFDRQFDAFWASHVLEHQRNPGLFLDRAFDCLNEGGLLALTIPSALAPLLMGHPTIMTPSHLIYHLVCAGFDCREAAIRNYDWQFSILLRKRSNGLVRRSFGAYPEGCGIASVPRLFDFFPPMIGEPLQRDNAMWGEINELNWESTGQNP